LGADSGSRPNGRDLPDVYTFDIWPTNITLAQAERVTLQGEHGKML